MATTQERIIELRAERETRLSRVQELVERKNRLEEERRLLTEEENRLRVARNREGLTDAERKNLDLQLKAASARRAYASKQLSNLAPKIKGRIDYAKQIDSRIDRLSRSEDVRSRDKKTDERLAKEAEEQELSRRVSVAREVQAQRIASRQTKQEIPTREGIRVSSSFISLAKERGVINEEGNIIRPPTTPLREEPTLAERTVENVLGTRSLLGRAQTRERQERIEEAELRRFPITTRLTAVGKEAAAVSKDSDQPTIARAGGATVATLLIPSIALAQIYEQPTIGRRRGTAQEQLLRETTVGELGYARAVQRTQLETGLAVGFGVTAFRPLLNTAPRTTPTIRTSQFIQREAPGFRLATGETQLILGDQVAPGGIRIGTAPGRPQALRAITPEAALARPREAVLIEAPRLPGETVRVGVQGQRSLVDYTTPTSLQPRDIIRQNLNVPRKQTGLFASRKGQFQFTRQVQQEISVRTPSEELRFKGSLRREAVEPRSFEAPKPGLARPVTRTFPTQTFTSILATGIAPRTLTRIGTQQIQSTRTELLPALSTSQESAQLLEVNTAQRTAQTQIFATQQITGLATTLATTSLLGTTLISTSVRRTARTTTSKRPRTFDLPNIDLPSGGLQDFSSSKRPRSDKRRKYLPSLTGIDRGIKATKKTATGFTGLELRGI